ncbi:unnamed protein product [Heterobilharzia americana]|nr:unnamed protein product [Heterobilharzia americana]
MPTDIITHTILDENGHAYKDFQKTGDYNSYPVTSENPVLNDEPVKSWDLDPPSSLIHTKYTNLTEDDPNVYHDPENSTYNHDDLIDNPLTSDYDALNRSDGNDDYLNPVETDAFLPSYADNYTSYDHTHGVDPVRPRSQLKFPHDQDSLESTYQNAYQPYKLETVSDYKPHEYYFPPQQPMATNTSYRIDYPPRYPEVSRSFKPTEIYTPPLVPMLNKTSYQTEYQSPPVSPTEVPFRMKDHETFPTGRFQNETTYGKDYELKWTEPVHSYKPYREYRVPIEPVSNETSYQMEYTSHLLSKPMSYAPNYVYQQPEVPFHKNTSYSEEFQPYNASRSESFKPIYEYRKPTMKIENNTVYSLNYRPWHAAKGEPYYPKDNLHLFHGNRDLTTSYTEEFQPRYTQRVHPIKPKENRWCIDEAVPKQTSYLTDFRSLTPDPSISYKPIEIYRSPSLPVVTQSSYAEDYVPIYTKKREPILLKSDLKTSKLPMEKNSSYSEEFQYRKAKRLENLKPLYQYTQPSVPFANKTSYQTEYLPPPKEHKENQSCPPNSRYTKMHPTATSYANDYKPTQNLTKLQPILQQDNIKINNLIDHNLKTSYSIDYVDPYQSNSSKGRNEYIHLNKRVQSKPISSRNILPKISIPTSRNTTFENRMNNHHYKTTYQQEFSKLPLIKKAPNLDHFRPQDYYVPPKIKMSNSTTYSNDYKWPESMTFTEERKFNDFENLNRPDEYSDSDLNNHNYQYFTNPEFTYDHLLSNRSNTVTDNPLNNNLTNLNYDDNKSNYKSINNSENNVGALGKFMNLMSKNRAD